jgi:hypothetical protein
MLAQYQAIKAELRRRAPESIWAFAHLMKNEKKEPFNSTRFPYMRQVLEDFHPLLVIQKGTQTSATYTMQLKEFFTALHRNVTIIHTMPTDEDIQDYSAARFGPMSKSDPYVAAKIADVDRVGLKTFQSGAAIYFRGTWSERATISIPADILNNDELDRQKPESRDELRRRLDASALGWEWAYSTPTIPGYGVAPLFEDSDQHVWVVKCEGCGRDNDIDGQYYFEGIKERRSSDSNGGKELYWSCKSCDKELDRRKGLWVPRKPGALARGYLIPQTIVPHKTPSSLRLEEKRTRNPAKFKRNQLAIPCSEGVQPIDRALLIQRSILGDEWATGADPVTGVMYPITLGVDQGDVLHYSLSAFKDGRRHRIKVGTAASFQEIADLINQYRVWVTVVDGNPNKKSAEGLAGAFPGRVFLCFYYDDRRGDGEQEKEGKQPWTVIVERTTALDEAAASWQVGDSLATKPADGALWEDWLSQMTNMQRDTEEDRSGRPRAVWRKTGPDHFRHADLYDQEALRLFLSPPGGRESVVEDTTRIKISEF